MRVSTARSPLRLRSAVEPVTGASPREHQDPGRRRRREPIVVHVPVPLSPCGAPSAVRDAYRLESPRRAVDLYL